MIFVYTVIRGIMEEKQTKERSSIGLRPSVKLALDGLKEHPRSTYDEVITKLLERDSKAKTHVL